MNSDGTTKMTKMSSTRIDRFMALVHRRPTAAWLVGLLAGREDIRQTRQIHSNFVSKVTVTVPEWIARLLGTGTGTDTGGTGTGGTGGTTTTTSGRKPTPKETAETIMAFAVLGALLDGEAVTTPTVWRGSKPQVSRSLGGSVASLQLAPYRFIARLTPREMAIFQEFGREAMVTDIPSAILTAAILGLGFVTGLHGIMTPPWQIAEWKSAAKGTNGDPADEFLVPERIKLVTLWLSGRGSISTAVAAGNILVRDHDPVGCVSHILIAAWESGFGRHLIPQVDWSDRLRLQVNRFLPKFIPNAVAEQRVGLSYRLTNVPTAAVAANGEW